MANNIKFEVKNADPVVDLKVKTPVELAGLQAELLAKKNELLGKKTIEEAIKFLEGLPIFSDDTKKLIVLGDKIMQFDSNDSKYQEALDKFKASIDEANTEIDSSKLFKEVQADNLLDSNKDIINKTQTQVINTSFFER